MLTTKDASTVCGTINRSSSSDSERSSDGGASSIEWPSTTSDAFSPSFATVNETPGAPNADTSRSSTSANVAASSESECPK